MPEFHIQRCLGRGGFGEVYKGVMSRVGGVEVDVAIKVLRPDLDPASQGVQRLRDEGRLLGRLTHPTILRVYDLVVINGRAALVSEYVGGADLGRLLRQEPLPPRAVFECIAQVAAALDAAWSWPSVTDGKPLHLVHRDIKPDNIRIDPHGVVKLLDFGIAQAQTVVREAQTSANIIMGSTQYLAPERLVQQEVGPESDVFGLGCTLFEALVGEALFARRSMRQMYLLMVDEKRFDQFVAERAAAHRERLGGERAVALFRAMTAWRKQSRPSSVEVAARCDQISDSTDGPTLTQWCRGRSWDVAPAPVEGPLDGMRFTTTHVDVAGLPEAVDAESPSPAGPIRRPPPEIDEDAVSRELVLGESTTRAMTAEREARSLYTGAVPWSAAELAAVLAGKPEPGIRIPQLVRQRWEGEAPEDTVTDPSRERGLRPEALAGTDLTAPPSLRAKEQASNTPVPEAEASPPPPPVEDPGSASVDREEPDAPYDADVAPTELVVIGPAGIPEAADEPPPPSEPATEPLGPAPPPELDEPPPAAPEPLPVRADAPSEAAGEPEPEPTDAPEREPTDAPQAAAPEAPAAPEPVGGAVPTSFASTFEDAPTARMLVQELPLPEPVADVPEPPAAAEAEAPAPEPEAAAEAPAPAEPAPELPVERPVAPAPLPDLGPVDLPAGDAPAASDAGRGSPPRSPRRRSRPRPRPRRPRPRRPRPRRRAAAGRPRPSRPRAAAHARARRRRLERRRPPRGGRPGSRWSRCCCSS
ncbi:MAG: serine/threonine-protein kinase [Myxococcota bacterium]